jgi:hypothetical protein
MRYEFSNEIPKDLPPGLYNTRIVETKWAKREEDKDSDMVIVFEFLGPIPDGTPREDYGLMPIKVKTLREDAKPSGTVENPDPALLGSSVNPTKPDDVCLRIRRKTVQKLWYCIIHREFHEIP